MLVRWGYRFPRRYSIVYRLKSAQTHFWVFALLLVCTHQGDTRIFSSQSSEAEDSPEIQEDLNYGSHGESQYIYVYLEQRFPSNDRHTLDCFHGIWLDTDLPPQSEDFWTSAYVDVLGERHVRFEYIVWCITALFITTLADSKHYTTKGRLIWEFHFP